LCELGDALGWIDNAKLQAYLGVVDLEVVDMDMVNPEVVNQVVVNQGSIYWWIIYLDVVDLDGGVISATTLFSCQLENI